MRRTNWKTVSTLIAMHSDPSRFDSLRIRAHEWATNITWPSILRQIEQAVPALAGDPT